MEDELEGENLENFGSTQNLGQSLKGIMKGGNNFEDMDWMMDNEENSDDEQIAEREDLETGPYTFSQEDLDGLPMPIQDDDFDNEETMVPISSSDEEPDLNKMISNGKNLDGLKLA